MLLRSIWLLLAAAIVCQSNSPRTKCSDDKRTSPSRVLRIDVQGWGEFENLPHSYAVVQRGVIGALQQVICIECSFRRVEVVNSSVTPLYQSSWLSEADVKSTIERLSAVEKEKEEREEREEKKRKSSQNVSTTTTTTTTKSCRYRLDATLRFSFPFDLSPSLTSKHTFVFATTEFGNVSAALMVLPDKTQRKPPVNHENLLRALDPSVTIVTPSDWSRAGFLHAGVPPEQVLVLRHGVDLEYIGPLSLKQRQASRLRYFPSSLHLHINHPKSVIYVNVGSATYNKGFDLILESFVHHYKFSPMGQHARLLLKGLDVLYKSRDLFHATVTSTLKKETSSLALQLMREGVIQYVGATMERSELRAMVCGCDVYLTPYRAEGFNMPAQEAAACGLTVIATSRWQQGEGDGGGGVGSGAIKRTKVENTPVSRTYQKWCILLCPSWIHCVGFVRGGALGTAAPHHNVRVSGSPTPVSRRQILALDRFKPKGC